MGQHIKLIFSLFFLINIIITILIIILERKRPEKTIAWLLIIVFMPPIGLLFYIFLPQASSGHGSHRPRRAMKPKGFVHSDFHAVKIVYDFF